MENWFFIRIELHNAVFSDYTTLHSAMEKAGFKRKVVADNGHTYHLPTAEYALLGNYTKDHLLSVAKSCIVSTGKKGMVLISQATSWTSDGLPLVS